MKRRIGLRVRFLVVLVILMLAIFGTITLLIVEQERSTLRNDLITESTSFAALATQQIGEAFVIYQDSGTIKLQNEISGFTGLDHNVNNVEVIDANGHQLFKTGSASILNVNSATAASLSPTYVHDKSGHLTAVIEPYIESYGIHHYDIIYGISYQSVNQDINNVVASIVAVSAAILLVSVGVWYMLVNRLFLQPIAGVSRIALLISKGDLSRQIHMARRDEIGDLAAAVDTMANSLKADIAQLKNMDSIKSEFLMITAHSLRTPLTIIEGTIDNFKAANPGQTLPIDLDSILINIKQLDHFAEDALTISTMEVGQSRVTLTPLELAPILKRIGHEFASLATQKKIQFSSNINTDVWVSLNQPYFHSALWNLLDNAYKFTAEHGSIELNAETKDDQVVITVKDNGIGVAQSEVPRLFTKFHRATDTLNYNYEGTGIGLYLTKLIVEQHGGSISVETAEGKGSVFTLQLPVAKLPNAGHSTDQ